MHDEERSTGYLKMYARAFAKYAVCKNVLWQYHDNDTDNGHDIIMIKS